MGDLIARILEYTAWRSEPPALMSAAQICISIVSAASAVIIAVLSSRSMRACASTMPAKHAAPGSGSRSLDCYPAEQVLIRHLACIGWLLALLEVCKQLFIYYIVSNGAYDWWYFPFQLCSVPMYLCIILPAVRGRVRDCILTFLSTYTMLGALAALVWPEDLLRDYTLLTVHGFLWHAVLLYISLIIPMTIGRIAGPFSLRTFAGAALIFAAMCAAAVAINIAAEPNMATGSFIHSYAAMFYMNPYHISPQPLVSSVQRCIGIPAGLLLYALVITAVAGMIDVLMRIFIAHR